MPPRAAMKDMQLMRDQIEKYGNKLMSDRSALAGGIAFAAQVVIARQQGIRNTTVQDRMGAARDLPLAPNVVLGYVPSVQHAGDVVSLNVVRDPAGLRFVCIRVPLRVNLGVGQDGQREAAGNGRRSPGKCQKRCETEPKQTNHPTGCAATASW